MSDMSSLKVAELKDLCKERCIEVPKGAKKADLIALLEPQEVEAEVIDNPTELAVSYTPAIIKADLTQLKKEIDKIVAQYQGWTPNPENSEDVEQAKRESTHLNKLKTALDYKRKEIKRQIEVPYKQFEAEIKPVIELIDSTRSHIKECVDTAEENRRAWVKQQLEEHYEAYAGLLVDVVPYDRIADHKWLNKTVNLQKAKQELEEKVDSVARDWETLKRLDLGEYYQQAEVQFFNTLDVSQAIQFADKLKQDAQRIDDMKAEMQSYAPVSEPISEVPSDYEPEYVPYEQYCPVEESHVRVERIERPQADEQGDLISEIASLLSTYTDSKLEKVLDALKSNQKQDQSEAMPWVIVISSATREQAIGVGKLCGLLGVTGRFSSGTLSEVYERELMGMVTNGKER